MPEPDKYESDRGISEQMPGQLLGKRIIPLRLAVVSGDDVGFSLRLAEGSDQGMAAFDDDG